MSKQVTRRPTKQDRRQERREEQLRLAAARQRAARNKRIALFSAIAAIVIIAASTVFFYVHSHNQSQSQAPAFTEQIFDPNYPPVDNVYCDQLEQLSYHIHVHLSIWINGQLTPVGQGVGIGTTQSQTSQSPTLSCYYWLHTHDSSGVVHIESPTQHTYTLGNFFDVWADQFQQLGYPYQLDLKSGWTAWVNGQPYKGDFRSIPLNAHTLITLAYNSPHAKPDTTYSWNGL